MIILRLFLGLALAWLLGLVLVNLIDKKRALSMIERAAIGYLIGQGLVTLLIFLLFLLPLANRPLSVAIVIVSSFVLQMIYLGRKQGFNYARMIKGIRLTNIYRAKMLTIVLLIAVTLPIGLKLSYLFVETCSKPEYSWDASGNWTGIGKNYYFTEKYRPSMIISELKNNVTGYPRSISIMHYWLFWWMGEANDQWSKIIFPLNTLCLLIIFYYGLKPSRGSLGALVFSWLLLSAPIFMYHSTIGYADLTKTVYFAVGMIYFYRWAVTQQSHYFWLFAIPMAITTWIKVEGKALYAIGLILLAYYLWRGCREPLKKKLGYFVSYISLFVMIGLPWQIFITLNGTVDLQRQALVFNYFKVIDYHREMYALMFTEGSWGIIWSLAAAALLLCFGRQLKGANIYLLFTLLLFYASLAFIIFGTVNPTYGISAIFNRLLLPIYPIVVFNLGCVLPSLEINKEIII